MNQQSISRTAHPPLKRAKHIWGHVPTKHDLRPQPLNISTFQQPFHCEIEHKLGMTCLTTGPVTCRVRLDRGGYVPGEAINIWATIDNQSKVTIKGTRGCLTEVRLWGQLWALWYYSDILQTIQYITKNKVMETESRELAAISRGKIRAGSTDDWKSEQLFVPPLPPTNLRGCHLIRIQYDVFVSFSSSRTFYPDIICHSVGFLTPEQPSTWPTNSAYSCTNKACIRNYWE